MNQDGKFVLSHDGKFKQQNTVGMRFLTDVSRLEDATFFDLKKALDYKELYPECSVYEVSVEIVKEVK